MTITTTQPDRSRRAARPEWRGTVRRWRSARRARVDLEKLEDLPDYLLDDIGLTRGGIRCAVLHRR